MYKLALIPELSEGEDTTTDFTLHPDCDSCWITVDNLSVYIVRTDEGVVVDIYPAGGEADESLASTYAFHTEGGNDDED